MGIRPAIPFCGSSASAFSRSLREGDIAARLGGDEFVVLQIGADNTDEIEPLARRIIREAHTPFAIDGKLISVGVSIGTALAPEHGR